MATARKLPLTTVRESVTRMQREGERMVARLRRDAEGFVTRGRAEVTKEVRDLERRVMKALHAATTDQVGRLERRLAALEAAVAKLARGSGA